MFTTTLLDWDDAALVAAGDAGYAQLVEICAPAAAHLGIDHAEGRAALEQLVWSQVHGRAHLAIERKLPTISGRARRRPHGTDIRSEEYRLSRHGGFRTS